MKFEKLFLISLGALFSFQPIVSLQAAESLQSMEAIWNSVGVAQTTTHAKKEPVKTVQNKYSEQKLVAAVKNKLEKQENAKRQLVSVKKQTIQRKPIVTKLDRQRTMWKAKWDAQQKAQQKKLLVSKEPINPKPKAPPTAELAAADISKAEIALVMQKPVLGKQLQTRTSQKFVQKQVAKPLTRAQYQWRWKQQQLKKQQQIVQGKPVIPTFTNEHANNISNRKPQPKT